jgi:malate dehydrogenase (oxaloacetate-decarboxylating)(NADP+)
VVNISPTFGGINLEDIAAPHCFEIEEALKARLDIPVFHDDQHGTAVVMCAGLLNALDVQGKALADIKLTCLGAGAAGLACMRLLIAMGGRKENMTLVDSKGVIHSGRTDLNAHKQEFAKETEMRTPGRCHAARSDYPNQVNNVLGFPYIFRGALDVRASRINQAMQIAAVEALRVLTHEPVPAQVLEAYGLQALSFGPDYIIPKPFDPRLRERVPAAVARAAVDSGVARLAEGSR